MLFLQHKLASASFLLLSLLYLGQTLFEKPDHITLVRYHISVEKAHVLGLTVAIPYIIIWLIALIGYLRLKSYQTLIKDSKDGDAFMHIANGMLWLGLFLPLNTLLGNNAQRYVSEHHAAANPIRLVNYIMLVILLWAVWTIYKGSRRLLQFVKAKDVISYTNAYQVFMMGFVAFSAVYTALVLHDPSRQFPAKGVAVGGYYEPDWLLVLTIIIPRLITWYLGLRAVLNMYLYRRKVNGNLYREALKHLAFGTGGVLTFIVVLRVIQTLSQTLTKYSLGTLLALIYGLLVLIGVSYIYVARGAKNLQKLEEI